MPAAQRAALEVAFGLRTDGTADRLLVGMALVGLLADSSRNKTVVCFVDDAHWLDTASAQAFAFAPRRLEAERAAFLFCLRDPAAAPLFAGLPQPAVAGLGKRDAEALLNAGLHGPLDPLVRDRVIAEARGNPLALIELPRSHGPTGFASGFALPEHGPWPGSSRKASPSASTVSPTRHGPC